MKAAVVEADNRLVIRDVPEPRVGDYQVKCELLWGSVCTGTDWHILQGKFPWRAKLPTILGHESVGRVVEVGPHVRNFSVGDLLSRVGTPPVGDCSVTWGGFAEYGIAGDHWAMFAAGRPAREWQSHRPTQVIPPHIDPRIGPMFVTWRETWSYITRRGVQPGMSIVIAGSGGTGLALAAHAINIGAEVTMVGAAHMADDAVSKLGIQHFFDYRREDLTAALNAANEDGYDFIIDSVGKVDNPGRLLPALKPGGDYAVYGLDDFGRQMIDPSRLRGPFTFHGHGGYDEAEAHGPISDLVLQGKLDASVWYDLDDPYPLTAIKDAFAAVQRRDSPKALVDLKR